MRRDLAAKIGEKGEMNSDMVTFSFGPQRNSKLVIPLLQYNTYI
jgi:hypothetical protein